MNNKYLGTKFDDFLSEEGILEECKEIAVRRVLAYLIRQLMQENRLSKKMMAEKIQVSHSTLNRLLDPSASVTLKTIFKAAQATGKKIEFSIR